MWVRTVIAVLAAAVLAPLPSTASQAASAAAEQDVVGLWDADFAAGMAAADCGRWKLDARGFCVADDVRNGVELGVKFQSSQAVAITGIRVYRVDPGAVTGSLRAADGTRLATGTFPATAATGWQDLTFSEPVTISPGRTYLASYYSPATKYAFRYGYFTDELSRGPITALRAAASDPNGVHCYDVANCQFPAGAFRDSNYWVSPLWKTPAGQPTPPPGVASTPVDQVPPMVRTVRPTNGAKRVGLRANINVTFTENVRSSLLTRASVRLLRAGHSRPVRVQARYDSRRHRLVLDPKGRLVPTTRYRVVISTSVVDTAGNRLDQDPQKPGAQRATWRFRTR